MKGEARKNFHICRYAINYANRNTLDFFRRKKFILALNFFIHGLLVSKVGTF